MSDQLQFDSVQTIVKQFYQECSLSIDNYWDSYCMHKFEANIEYYRIEGGTDMLVKSMIADCQTIESNRCSIRYSSLISQVQLLNSNKVLLITSNNVSQLFDTVVVSTTTSVAQLIEFEPRIYFREKYLAMQQVNYLCATKIFLSFNVSWWYTQENITGGVLTTDLLLRSVYYPYTNANQTNGGTILAAYAYSQDAIIWQAFSDTEAMELALKLLIKIHKSSSNILDYFQGGVVKHWCQDPYTRAGFAHPAQIEESHLAGLQSFISNIHFIGEHTSIIRGWVEGALSSAIRTAVFITEIEPTQFEVIIIGGNPIGLITAVFLSLKQPTLRIAIIEKETIMNFYRSSRSFDQLDFRQIFNEKYLTELGSVSFNFWRQLEQLANMSSGSILNTDIGYLFVGNLHTNQSTIEGDFASIQQTCEKLQINCEYLNHTQLQMRYPTFSFSQQSQGIFHHQSGYINVNALIVALLRILSHNSNIIIREQEEVLSLTLNNQTQIVTNHGTLSASRKILFVPSSYAKNMFHLLNLNINITFWELPVYYFRLLPNATQLPTWLAWDDNNPQSLFVGFPSISTSSNYVAITPRYIKNPSALLTYSSQEVNKINELFKEKVIEWVSRHMSTQINVSDYYSNNETYLATFLPDNGFLLDYVPQTNRRVLIQAADWSMKFAPVWGDILSDMILFDEVINTSSKYKQYMEYFSLYRPNRLIENAIETNKGFRLVSMYFLALILSIHNVLF